MGRLTLAAQEGLVSFGEAMRVRLGLMRPSLASLRAYRKGHTGKLSPGVVELIVTTIRGSNPGLALRSDWSSVLGRSCGQDRLRALGKRVFFVSGGFKQLIEPVAASCDIPMDDVYANGARTQRGALQPTLA